MEPLKEAMILLDQSLERLENGIKNIKDKNTVLLAYATKQKDTLLQVEEKKQKTLHELYILRDMIAQELQIGVEKTIVNKRQKQKPSIFMSDDEE